MPSLGRALLGAAFCCTSILAPVCLEAQDPFEIQVYEYELGPVGVWNLETHMNYTARASRGYNLNQAHLTFELTRGISKYFELAGYMLNSYDQGHGEIAGWHIRPRFTLPEEWLPVK